MKLSRRTLFVVLAVVILLVLNGMILQKERLIAESESVFLPLAPVDPRSLIQGDYMDLRYDIPQQLTSREDVPRKGNLLVTLDAEGIGTIQGFASDPELQARAPNTVLIQYKKRGNRISIGAESFFFQETHAPFYEEAAFAELAVAEDGRSVLLALKDSSLSEILIPEEEP